MSGKNPTKVVFVGNIPYDVPEEQLLGIFRQVGPVASFRMVFDRESGKPKGYGFCEYFDVETATSAVRNLVNYEVNGRNLRIDFAENETARDGSGQSRPAAPSGGGSFAPAPMAAVPHASLPAAADPAIPSGPPPSTEAINATLSMMPPTQLLEILTQMKSLVHANPDQARRLFLSNPQLSYAIFQALLTMRLVDQTLLQKVSQNFGRSDQDGAAAPAQQRAAGDQISEQQKALLMQIMQMTEDQVNSLPADQKIQVQTLRSQMLNTK